MTSMRQSSFLDLAAIRSFSVSDRHLETVLIFYSSVHFVLKVGFAHGLRCLSGCFLLSFSSFSPLNSVKRQQKISRKSTAIHWTKKSKQFLKLQLRLKLFLKLDIRIQPILANMQLKDIHPHPIFSLRQAGAAKRPVLDAKTACFAICWMPER